MLGGIEMSRESVAKRMERSSELNRELFWEYYNQQLEQGKNISTVPSAISKFIEAAEHKDITLLEIEDIRLALPRMKLAPSTINSRIDFLKSFLTFISDRIDLKLVIRDLDSLKVEQSKVLESKGDKWEALTVDDVIALRLKLRELKRFKALYYFEMFYTFGIETEEITNLHIENYIESERKFRVGNIEYKLPTQLFDVLDHNIIPKKKLDNTAPSYYLTPIKNIFGKKVSRGDIVATRNQNFFNCPKCGAMFEAAPGNWLIFHYEIDNSQWIVCRQNCFAEGENE